MEYIVQWFTSFYPFQNQHQIHWNLQIVCMLCSLKEKNSIVENTEWTRFWAAAIALRFCQHLPSCAAVLNPKHTIYALLNLYYWNCNKKRTKINKKRPGLDHFLNLYYWNYNEKKTKINKTRPGLAHFKNGPGHGAL